MPSHAHNKVDKLSDRITSLVPDFIQDEAPVFEQFLKHIMNSLRSLNPFVSR